MRVLKNLLNMLFATAKAKIMPLWIKLRMWTTPSFIKTRVFTSIRQFFSNLLDIRPRNKQDYYPIFNWLVSKRFAFVLVVALGIGSAIYISAMLPESFPGGGSTIRTYKYRSIPLKFYSGTVQITARDGYVAYKGQVDKGVAAGQGTLYAADGSVVYEGQFADSKYNGQGTLFYPGGTPQYTGGFTDNVFNGVGSYFRPSGVLEYSGNFEAGVRSGEGALYDSVGSRVYQGNFLNGEIVYQDFLTRPTGEVTDLYSGDTSVYQSEDEYCVTMPEIDAVYAVKDGSNTLENEWTVDRIYVLRDIVPLEGGTCGSIREIMSVMGQPLYFGTVWVELPEAVAWNLLAEERPNQLEQVDVTAEPTFENVFSVSNYDQDYQLYLYTFEYDGLLYHFYFSQSGESQFLMYAMEKA